MPFDQAAKMGLPPQVSWYFLLEPDAVARKITSKTGKKRELNLPVLLNLAT